MGISCCRAQYVHDVPKKANLDTAIKFQSYASSFTVLASPNNFVDVDESSLNQG